MAPGYTQFLCLCKGAIIFTGRGVSVCDGIVSFDRSGLGLSMIMNNSIPWNTTHVNFEQNLISHIYADYFKNLSELVYISFHDNLISDIEDYSFVVVHTVKEIDLSKNKLSLIRRHMFSGLNNQEILRLSTQSIYDNTDRIQNYSFIENTAMRKLYLQYNAPQGDNM